MTTPIAPRTRDGFKLAIICALKVEAEGVRAVFDKCWEDEGRFYGKAAGDKNIYTTGVIGRHNVVLVLLPNMGSVSAAQTAASLVSSFPKVELVLLVGICGVVPVHPVTKEEILLGDVVISTAVTQYDYGSQYPGGFRRKSSIYDSLRKAPKEIQAFINKIGMRQNLRKLQTDLTQLVGSIESQQHEPMAVYPGVDYDHLYEASYLHQHRPAVSCTACYDGLNAICSSDCDQLGCEEGRLVLRIRHDRLQRGDVHSDKGPVIHLGRFGSADTVMKSGIDRDALAGAEELTAFEMEGAGLWDEHATIVIKAACDYADSHKNKTWQPYAAMVAAACLKVVLAEWVQADEPTNNNQRTEANSLGLCLASAPLIQPKEFVGRIVEIDTMHGIIQPNKTPSEQRRVVLGGMGGIGKTQLAIAYARRYENTYTTVLWLNATSELTLQAGFRSVLSSIINASELEKFNNEQIVTRVQEWLSHPQNHKWLLIFDNYDEPDHFNISKFYPNTSHGSIIITTRLPDMVAGPQVRVQPLKAMNDCLDILCTRSGRERVDNDIGACRLVERLAGLPLALVTAGAYLRKITMTFQEYLDVYEQRWQVDRRRPVQLQEYQDRTLYTTWNLSYNRLEKDDPEAAQMLKLLAYFDHQEVSYILFKLGLPNHLPVWLSTSLTDRSDFESMMGTLVDYCLLEVQHTTQSYSMHGCVHDWTLCVLNQAPDPQLYWYAFDCVAAGIAKNDWDQLGQLRYTRLSRHGVRLTHHHFTECEQLEHGLLERGRLRNAAYIARMLHDQMQYSAAEQMYVRALAGHEKSLGPNHFQTLGLLNNLAILCRIQGRFGEAEQMFVRALAGHEKSSGPNHVQTLDLLNNLAILRRIQGRFGEAEQMCLRVLNGYKELYKPNHISSLGAIYNLGILYCNQGRFREAEEMYLKALSGCKERLGLDHTLTLDVIVSLGSLYYEQGNLEVVEQMYLQGLAGYERITGPIHTSTLTILHNLGLFYAQQDRPEAEQMYRRAIAGYVKIFGPDHPTTLQTVHNLGVLYTNQGKLEEAEQILISVIAGRTKALGSDHPKTLGAVGLLNEIRDRLANSGNRDSWAVIGPMRPS